MHPLRTSRRLAPGEAARAGGKPSARAPLLTAASLYTSGAPGACARLFASRFSSRLRVPWAPHGYARARGRPQLERCSSPAHPGKWCRSAGKQSAQGAPLAPRLVSPSLDSPPSRRPPSKEIPERGKPSPHASQAPPGARRGAPGGLRAGGGPRPAARAPCAFQVGTQCTRCPPQEVPVRPQGLPEVRRACARAAAPAACGPLFCKSGSARKHRGDRVARDERAHRGDRIARDGARDHRGDR
jgi:hypothetical protein